ncbi:hypothetical protein RRF57_007390 [Xylaria bambusicola]|uniref:C2H2-type domain-containing protein n=1 Tax=Xylaria bambusicola TaxID=326684 RepID=A0AAN7UTL0_9PEZI
MAGRQRVFACPFIFKDPRNHLGCRKYGLRRIKDVKQHLLRVHQRPPYCPRCYDTFSNAEERDNHIRVCQVENHPPVDLNGISDDQQMILRRRSNSKHTVEEQWYFLWETLFPNTDRPTGVYLDEVYSNEMCLLRGFMTTEGVGIFRNCLNAQAGIDWRVPANEKDDVSFQESVCRGVLERLFEGWSDYCTGGVVDPQQPAIPALPAAGTSAKTSSQINSLDWKEFHEGADASSSMSFYEISSAEGALETTSHPESNFDDLFVMLKQQQ